MANESCQELEDKEHEKIDDLGEEDEYAYGLEE